MWDREMMLDLSEVIIEDPALGRGLDSGGSFQSYFSLIL